MAFRRKGWLECCGSRDPSPIEIANDPMERVFAQYRTTVCGNGFPEQHFGVARAEPGDRILDSKWRSADHEELMSAGEDLANLGNIATRTM